MAKSPIDTAKDIALNVPGMAASGEFHAPEGGNKHIPAPVYEIPPP
jgi:hypothetical protein